MVCVVAGSACSAASVKVCGRSTAPDTAKEGDTTPPMPAAVEAEVRTVRWLSMDT